MLQCPLGNGRGFLCARPTPPATIRGMDENPYRSPLVPPVPPESAAWRPNYRSAAFGSVVLGFQTLTLVGYVSGLVSGYAQGAPLVTKELAGFPLILLMVYIGARWVWRALRYGE